RYALLRWAQRTFRGFAVVPPDTGIVHQVNLEYLARVVFTTEGRDAQAYPDTLVGTDSHTTMINGLGVLGWGVGGIEAEAAMLGQPVSMLIPEVVGFRLHSRLPEGATATDLVLTVTEMLRQKGVVGKFVEFYGPGLAELPLAGPKRPQDRVPLRDVKASWPGALHDLLSKAKTKDGSAPNPSAAAKVTLDGATHELKHGSVVIAAITSCTNTSNPSVMMAAGLLAKKAVERGLQTKPWVKTSLAPGSKVVTDYLIDAGLMRYLEQLRFYLVGYGCTTCIGNSGPLPPAVSKSVEENGLVVAAVLSGNRNFEGRIQSEVRV